MRVRSLMVKDPLFVLETSTITDAMMVMKEHGIRHLPVLNRDRTLAGFVTLDALKQGLIPSMVADVQLKDLMIKEPLTAHPDDDVEAVARLIYQKKVGGLPVIDESNRLVGILTVIDILRAFIEMMGILTASSRVDVAVGEGAEAVNRVSAVITGSGAQVLSVARAAHRKDKNIWCFRMEADNPEEVCRLLEEAGFSVEGLTG